MLTLLSAVTTALSWNCEYTFVSVGEASVTVASAASASVAASAAAASSAAIVSFVTAPAVRSDIGSSVSPCAKYSLTLF